MYIALKSLSNDVKSQRFYGYISHSIQFKLDNMLHSIVQESLTFSRFFLVEIIYLQIMILEFFIVSKLFF